MDPALETALNLLLESERAGVAALEMLLAEAKHPELRRFLAGSREVERRNADELADLIRANGGRPSDRTGPFAAKVAAMGTLREQLNLMARGQEWAARKTEQALALAPPAGAIRDYLAAMANRHRAEAEWGRAAVIKLLDTLA
ncbi:MAG: DUF6306 domain-containing protein [Candidatus Binataceae bacterium]